MIKGKLGSPQMAQMIKNPPAMQETRVQPQGQEDPLEKGMTAHSSILAWRIPWTAATVHEVTERQTGLSSDTFTFRKLRPCKLCSKKTNK